MEEQQSFEDSNFLPVPEFTQAQIEQLTRLRGSYIEKARKQMLEERRRLEFARWLVVNGRLTDGFPIRKHKNFYTYPLYPYTKEN
ncbi:MAG TPA: hypothetical protein VKP04_05385 [Ktedonobacteraceae bacterium]|nr:hypothetical protein [Ktedonobacteraceae bacterium]